MQTKKLCKYPGCFNYATEGGYCDKHQGYRVADAQKPKTPWDGAGRPNDALYNTSRWRTLKAKIIKQQGQCAICGATINLTVHHVVPPKGDPDLFFDEHNLVVLCKQCHDRQTALENRNKCKR